MAAGYIQNDDMYATPVVCHISASGVFDPNFGVGGIASVPTTEAENEFTAIAVQSDGKIVAAGHISNGLNWFSGLIARFTPDGILDPSYGTNGVVNINIGNVDDEFFDLVLTADDKAYLTGFTVTQTDIYYHMLLMKYTSSGVPDPSFGNNGLVITGTVNYTMGDAIVMQPDGKLLICGSTGDLAPANNDWAVWRYNADGTADAGFGTNGVVTTDFFGNPEEALGIGLYQNRIITAGKLRNADNFLDFGVAVYHNDITVGISDPTGSTVSISPNPVLAGGRLVIRMQNGFSGRCTVELTDLSGSVIQSGVMEQQSCEDQEVEFSLRASIRPGLYFLRLSAPDSGETVHKIVVY